MQVNNQKLGQQFEEEGFAIFPGVYGPAEIQLLNSVIDDYIAKQVPLNTQPDLFAIRNLLGEIPGLAGPLFNEKFRNLIEANFGKNYFCVKGIYFDKPPLSNWLVSWHQDLMISVDARQEISGFGPWSEKKGIKAVQPTRNFLENIVTARIHLDDCDVSNGALKVVPGSHRMGILQTEEIRMLDKKVAVCEVPGGGVHLMKPLLLHSSSKSEAKKHRRVIHLEFASQELPGGLKWKERRSWS